MRYKNGQKPQLVMLSDGEVAETVPIGGAGWTVDTVAEYLLENLAAA